MKELELIFIATDVIDKKILLNEDCLFEEFAKTDENGFWGFESTIIEEANLTRLLEFIFQQSITFDYIEADKSLINLSIYKENCLNNEILENKYSEWIEISCRENTMDEYGSLIGIIGYIEQNKDKAHLILKVQDRLK